MIMKPAVSLLILILVATAPARSEDPIAEMLDNAKEVYRKSIEEARRPLLKRFDELESVARVRGDIDAVDLLQKERLAFEGEGTLPQRFLATQKNNAAEKARRRTIDSYRNATEKAKTRLTDAYTVTIKDYVIQKNDKAAKAIKLQMTEFQKNQTSLNGWKQLFNGKDLAGWKVHPDRLGSWKVEEGILIGSGPGLSYLYSERGDYQDVHLRIETRVNDGGNSGVFVRVPSVPANPAQHPQGYEAQIASTHRDPNRTGSLYIPPDGAVVKVPVTPIAPGEWFVLELIVSGNRIVIKVNGIVTAEFADEKQRYASGHIALQQHNPETRVEFRKIEFMHPSSN